MSKEQTIVKECFTKIGERFDGITRSLKRNYLPYDAEVEYIQNDGTNYIDTGIGCGPNIDFSLTFMFPEGVPKNFQMGIGGEAFPHTGCFIYSTQDTYFFVCNYGQGTTNSCFAKTNLSTFYTIGSIGKSVFGKQTVVGQQNTISTSYITGKTITLLAKKNISSSTLEETISGIIEVPVRISQVSYRNNGKTFSMFIPVRKGAEGFLYDMFSGQMVGSATNTPLVPGPDKA